MKFMIAGLGSIGRRHLNNLVALGENDILLYRTYLGTLPDDELAGFPVETDLKAALAHHPDAVVVSNPTALHLEVAIPAAEAGCHLLLEKPISNALDGLDELREVVADGGGRVLVGFQFRYHPGLRKINELLSSGEVGRPLSVHAHWGEYLPDWHPWEDYRKGYSARSDLGGGVALTLCHPLDYLRWLLGEVTGVWAFSSNSRALDIEVEDTVEIGLRFASGMIGSVHLDFNQRPASHRLEIVLTGGTIRWDNLDGGVEIYRAENESWKTYPSPDGFERNDLFRSQMHHFREVIKGEVMPECSLEDGIRALELVAAAHSSAKEGRIISFDE
jgi:predicted dehydrogenase